MELFHNRFSTLRLHILVLRLQIWEEILCVKSIPINFLDDRDMARILPRSNIPKIKYRNFLHFVLENKFSTPKVSLSSKFIPGEMFIWLQFYKNIYFMTVNRYNRDINIDYKRILYLSECMKICINKTASQLHISTLTYWPIFKKQFTITI